MPNSGDLQLTKLGGDLKISNGDFLFTDNSVQQNIQDILLAIPGDWIQFPLVGCALETYQDGQINGLDSIIKKQLISDGININIFNISLNSLSKLDINIIGSRT